MSTNVRKLQIVLNIGFMSFAWMMIGQRASGQVAVQPSFREEASSSDIRETEDVVSDNDMLPSESQKDRVPVAARIHARVPVAARIHASQNAELSLSNEELRSRFKYDVAIGIGSTIPWQAYTVEAAFLYDPRTAAGFFGGSGRYSDVGQIADAKAYDIDFNTNSFGVFGRYYFSRLSPLAVQAMFGYANWSGSITPRGTDTLEQNSDAERLASSFTANGFFTGLSAIVSGVWESGVLVEWTAIGVHKSWLWKRDLIRDSDELRHVMDRNIENAHLFGFSDIKVGYCF
jgi:hypothetical protein